MKLYHIHKNNQYDDLYYEGNTLEFGEKPNQMFNCFLNESSTYVHHKEIKDGKPYIYHKDLLDVLDIDILSKMDETERNNVLNYLNVFVQNAEIDYREMILEEVRYKYFPTRPSRYTCMWLTDEECLDRWYKSLHKPGDGEYKIFEVEAEGNIFLSSSKLLPGFSLPHYIMYEQAHKYWEPDDKILQVKESREYLLEGTARIIKRVK